MYFSVIFSFAILFADLLLSKYVYLFSKNEHSDPTGKDSNFVTILQGWNLFSAIRIKFMLKKTATQEKSSN